MSRFSRIVPVALCTLLAVTAGAADTPSASPARAPAHDEATELHPEFNTPTNLLIADQFNNRVIEVLPSGEIIWQYGQGPKDVSGESPIGPKDVERLDRLTLITAGGVPAGAEPACPKGCVDNRVLLVDPAGQVVWQYGKFGVTGSGKDELDRPMHATVLQNGNILITDKGNHRVIEVRRKDKEIVWQYGETGKAGSGPNQLSSPCTAVETPDGDIVIADMKNDRAIRVSRDKEILNTYTSKQTAADVTSATWVPELDAVLITEQGHKRIALVNALDRTSWSAWTYVHEGSNSDPQSSRATRLSTDDTLIADQLNHRVILVDPRFEIIASYGTINKAGYGTQSTDQGLNGPHDAAMIGE